MLCDARAISSGGSGGGTSLRTSSGSAADTSMSARSMTCVAPTPWSARLGRSLGVEPLSVIALGEQ